MQANLALLDGLREDGHEVSMLANVSKRDLEKEKVTNYKTTTLQLQQETQKEGETINIYTFIFDGIDVVALDCDELKDTILHPDNLPNHLRYALSSFPLSFSLLSSLFNTY